MFAGGTRKCLHEDRQRALRHRAVAQEQHSLGKSIICNGIAVQSTLPIVVRPHPCTAYR